MSKLIRFEIKVSRYLERKGWMFARDLFETIFALIFLDKSIKRLEWNHFKYRYLRFNKRK